MTGVEIRPVQLQMLCTLSSACTHASYLSQVGVRGVFALHHVQAVPVVAGVHDAEVQKTHLTGRRK